MSPATAWRLVCAAKLSKHAVLSPQRQEHLAQTFRQARRDAAMTQEALAVASGVATQHIARIEGAQANPTLATLYALTDALGVRPGDLLS